MGMIKNLLGIFLFVFQVIGSICFICKPIAGFEWLGLVSLNFGLIIFMIMFAIIKQSIKDADIKKEKTRLEAVKLAMSIVVSQPNKDLSKKIVDCLNEILST